jgi:Arc/MetJ-type ribon-helix-helix transcriptional regulator
MSVEVTELEQFQRFLTRWLQDDDRHQSLDHVVREFRLYLTEVSRFHAELNESIDEVARGEAAPLDVEALKAEIRSEMAADRDAG